LKRENKGERKNIVKAPLCMEQLQVSHHHEKGGETIKCGIKYDVCPLEGAAHAIQGAHTPSTRQQLFF
jgi:hypothetical protein